MSSGSPARSPLLSNFLGDGLRRVDDLREGAAPGVPSSTESASSAAAEEAGATWLSFMDHFFQIEPTGLPAEPGAPRRRRREDAGGMPSRFTLMVRESEYTDEVDFLDNHNKPVQTYSLL